MTEQALASLQGLVESLCGGQRWTSQSFSDYTKACEMIQDDGVPIAPDDATRGLSGCKKELMTTVASCSEFDEDRLEQDRRVILSRHAAPPALLVPTPSPRFVPAPGVTRAEEDEDRKDLIEAYQNLANMTSTLCSQPEEYSLPNLPYCHYRSEANRIEKKYEGLGLHPPATYDDVANSACGRELLGQLMGDSPDWGCEPSNRTYFAQWAQAKARPLHAKHYGTPSSPSQGPRNPQPNGGGGSGGCPPGTHPVGPGVCGRAPDPL